MTDSSIMIILWMVLADLCIGKFSYNQPKFCPNATWNPNATTFADVSQVGNLPQGLFVNMNDTVYAAARNLSRVQVWVGGSIGTPTSIVVPWIDSRSLFATANGDIYFDNGQGNQQVNRWTMSTGTVGTVMSVNDSCRGLFIDSNSTLYCSVGNVNRVFKVSLTSATIVPSVVAGTGVNGSAMDELWNPEGLFVNFELRLYVADRFNHRIQAFASGNTSAETVAGNGTSNTISLYEPTGVVLDADGYLFITDRKNHRIVGSGPNGFRCVAGCSVSSSISTSGFGTVLVAVLSSVLGAVNISSSVSVAIPGSAPGNSADQLNEPQTMSFDRDGNIFVTDQKNHRVQKFWLLTNSCSNARLPSRFIHDISFQVRQCRQPATYRRRK